MPADARPLRWSRRGHRSPRACRRCSSGRARSSKTACRILRASSGRTTCNGSYRPGSRRRITHTDNRAMGAAVDPRPRVSRRHGRHAGRLDRGGGGAHTDASELGASGGHHRRADNGNGRRCSRGRGRRRLHPRRTVADGLGRGGRREGSREPAATGNVQRVAAGMTGTPTPSRRSTPRTSPDFSPRGCR